jgi:hypothetical protein
MLRQTTYKSIAAGAITLALAMGPGGVTAEAAGVPAHEGQDRRSADAIDSDLRSAARLQDQEDEGFGWDDAAIGGVALIGTALAVGGGAVVVTSHRRERRGAALPR